MSSESPILITVVTGFLGSGKTTMILNLVPQMPDTKFAILKNEFGDVAVDSQLACASAIQDVREMLNGCICWYVSSTLVSPSIRPLLAQYDNNARPPRST